MFTGIVQKIVKVVQLIKSDPLLSYCLEFDEELLKGLALGASVSIEGACQSVTKIEKNLVWFDAIKETTLKTTLEYLQVGSFVNVERAAKFGDEIGGHFLTGHICCRAEIVKVEDNIYTFKVDPEWHQFIFPKGFVALNGMSLTVCHVERKEKSFTVHLIPETLKRTTTASKKVGDWMNLEVDYLVQSYISHRKVEII